jgi:hypothetical protein
MKIVLHYRHDDGRQIEIAGDSSSAEIWQIYPSRELLKSVSSMDEGKKELPDGFALDDASFTPPCPKCTVPSPMSTTSGMYVCRECETEF